MLDDKYLDELLRESKMASNSDNIRFILPKLISELKFLRRTVHDLTSLANRDDRLVLETLQKIQSFYRYSNGNKT